jgi:uncharacterized damage-inducible protein DinB
MLSRHLRRLFGYNYWANHLLLDKAAEISNEQFLAETRFPHGGLRDTFAHLIYAEWVWRERCEGRSPLVGDKMPEAGDFPDLATMGAFWIQEEQRMNAYLANLTDERAVMDLHHTSTKNEPFSLPIEDILSHIVIHGMQHRSEIAQMLTELGHSPGDIDYMLHRRKLAS